MLNKIEATLISTLTSITLNEVNQNIVTKYRLNDLNQWVLTNSKTYKPSGCLTSDNPKATFISNLTKIQVFLTNILVKMTKIM